jgi:ERF superfamily
MSDHPKRRASDNRVRKARTKPQAKPSDVAVARKNLVVPNDPVTSMMNFIAEAMTNKDIDEHKLEVLLRLQRDVRADEAKEQFGQAMFRLQARLKPMLRQGVVDLGQNKGSYKFLRREDQDKILRPLMEEEGFSCSYTQHRTEHGLVVTATLTRGGHSVTSDITLPPDAGGGGTGRNALQAIGSAISYAERYLTEMLFNIVRTNDDDDGVKGGARYITEEQVAELHTLCNEAGRTEEGILRSMFGDAVHSFNEIRADDTGYVGLKNMLLNIRHRLQQQQQKPGED